MTHRQHLREALAGLAVAAIFLTSIHIAAYIYHALGGAS